ncbi:hypothetical protein BC835DRAFT_594108 [Cytidiella melzeri]|nr:hypothetical protein BC835DRAFT_594108 [Cytidiella melzeri]
MTSLQGLLMLAWAVAILLSSPVNSVNLAVNGVSRPCAPGTFSPSGRTPCQPCPKGSFTGHWSSTRCESAKAGYYVPVSGSSAPFTCEPGSYSDKGSSECALALKDVTPEANSRSKPRPPAKRPCAFGLQHCPIYGRWSGGTFVKRYECLDTQHELESCGGCVHTDSLDGDTSSPRGRDCSAITGVDTVRCVLGKCIVDKCTWGYAISADKSQCRSVYGKYY